MVPYGKWENGAHGEGSGKLPTPSKTLFQLAPYAVLDATCMVDKDGISDARKAMITTGLLLRTTGFWSASQPLDDPQDVIIERRVHFNGIPVCPADIKTASEWKEGDEGNRKECAVGNDFNLL